MPKISRSVNSNYGYHLSRKPRNVWKFNSCQGNVRGETCQRKLSIVYFRFGTTLVFSGLLPVTICEGFICLLSH